jgi:hypothetical protein
VIVAAGVGNFQGLIVTVASACLQMRFSRLGLRSIESNKFVTVAGEPSELVFADGFAPSLPRAGVSLYGQPWLQLRDRYGNLCENFVAIDSSSIQARVDLRQSQVWQGMQYSVRGDALLGTTAQQVIAGGSRFTDLRIDIVGVYRLVFRLPSLSLQVASSDLIVQAGAGSKLKCIQVRPT